MTSFLSRLFGRPGKAEAAPAAPEQKEVYNDLDLIATPIVEGSQFRLAGRIERRDGDIVLVRTFIRADMFSVRDDAVSAAFRKGRQIADQHGASLFSDGEPSRPV